MRLGFLLFVLLLHSFLLQAQQDYSVRLFNDPELLVVEVSIPADTLAWIYTNTTSYIEHHADVRLSNSTLDTLIQNVGFRLRGNTSRKSGKKSFKISFNAWEDGREFCDLSCLNLNGEHNDPSIIRSKLCFDLMQEAGMKASRTHHAKVYINGNYYGLYMLVENIDKKFIQKRYGDPTGNLWKCLYPADLVYLGNDPDLYRNLNNGSRPSYKLKTNEQEADFSTLARFVRIINNTGSSVMRDSLESVSEPFEFLQYFALNNLLGSWDEYWSLKNNYYLYHEPAEDRIHLIPYDYDNTFGVDWFSEDWARTNPYVRRKIDAGVRPLAENLLRVDAYRDLYTHCLEYYNDHLFVLSRWEYRLDSLRNLIQNAASTDLFRTYDYGFTYDDFLNSYTSGTFTMLHVKNGIKEFVNIRNTSLPEQLNYKDSGPVGYCMNVVPRHPKATDSIHVLLSAFSYSDMASVNLYYTATGSTQEVEIPLKFNPVKEAIRVEEADRWEAVIPPLGEGGSGSFYMVLTDFSAQSSLYPSGRKYQLKTLPTMADHIVINEFMARNRSYMTDQNGEYDDWIELYNPTVHPVLLTGMYLTDSRFNLTKWMFDTPDLYLNPGEFISIWCDGDIDQTGYHTSFKLNDEGEFIGLVQSGGKIIIDSVTYGKQAENRSWGRYPDASVYTGFMPGSMNELNNKVLSVPQRQLYEPGLTVYPNPFYDHLTIAFDGLCIGDASVRLFDITGRQVYYMSMNNGTTKIELLQIPAESLAPGTYTLIIKNDSKTWKRKIIRLQ